MKQTTQKKKIFWEFQVFYVHTLYQHKFIWLLRLTVWRKCNIHRCCTIFIDYRTTVNTEKL